MKKGSCEYSQYLPWPNWPAIGHTPVRFGGSRYEVLYTEPHLLAPTLRNLPRSPFSLPLSCFLIRRMRYRFDHGGTMPVMRA
jgi:hypothetical protein